jgi:hypothetical protein
MDNDGQARMDASDGHNDLIFPASRVLVIPDEFN